MLDSFIKECLDKIYTDHEHANLAFELINIICFNISDLLTGLLVIYTCISVKTKRMKQEEKNKK